MKTDLNIKVNSIRMKNLDMVFKYLKMGIYMKGNGEIINKKVKEF